MTGSELRALRKELGLTLTQMAKVFGVTAGLLSFYENGKLMPSVKVEHDAAELKKLDIRARTRRLQKILGGDIGYKQTGVRATGVIARALMEQYGYGLREAFGLAHYSLYETPPRFTEPAMVDAWRKAAGKTKKITKVQLQEMLAKYAERNKIK